MSFIERFRQSQPLSFAEYMQMVLYEPALGYYSAGLEKIGKHGDFITAPEMGPCFAYALANQMQAILQQSGGDILEFGAGTGRLCVDSLKRLDALDALPAHYYILELSASLRARQQALVEAEIPALAERVVWLNAWPEKAFRGVIIANEVLDAMPVQRFMQTESGLLESFISLDEKGQLAERFQVSENSRLMAYLETALPKSLPLPYVSEANLFIEGWMQSCFEMLEQGVMLLIDYGFPRHEYYHPDRSQGTIMCHYQHRAHSDFLAHPAEQDITAHVDFTHVAEAGFDAGFHVAGYTSQAAFLMSNGILNYPEALDDAREKLQANQQLKQLLQANEMGELFKVIALTKDFSTPLQGFQLQDRRASL